MFETSPIAQIVLDTQGIVRKINRQAHEMLKLNLRDLDRPFQDLQISYRPVSCGLRLRRLTNKVTR